jgi:FAD/FMN-containing dehydrogenase
MRWTKRRVLVGCSIALPLAIAALVVGIPASMWLHAWWRDQPIVDVLPVDVVDDASRLNAKRVAEVWPIPAEPSKAEEQLRALLKRASANGLKVAIAGARHSMGGHTIYPGGIVLDMLPFNHMELDSSRSILTVGAGARWSDVIPFLDARGFSVAVMQASNDFTIGGSLSVNCHGWQHNQPPISSTVESLRLANADGSIVVCSRSENPELFSLVLGGYGLFGVILEASLRVVPNERYRTEVEVLPAARYAARFAEKVNGAADIGMVYGRSCVVPGENFLRESILTVFRRAPGRPEEIPALSAAGSNKLLRAVYRAQIGSDSGKLARWHAEKLFGENFSRVYISRNQLLNEKVEAFRELNADRTDVLHEYFLPADGIEAFLSRARSIIATHRGDLLNVTIRNVLTDNDSFLRYAVRDVFGFVMLFNQARTPEADHDMEAMTRKLIDAALDCGGRYYLTYRLHATLEQFTKAYPQAPAFFERKRQHDPSELFQNEFYVKYGRGR